MTPTQWMRENHRNYENRKEVINACATATGSHPQVCRKLYSRLVLRGEINQDAVKVADKPILAQTPQKVGLTEQELREKYDIAYIITNQAAQLQKGIYLSESEFIVRCKIRAGWGYKHIMEHPDFKKYKGRARDGVIYWSHPDSIAEKKEMTLFT